MELYPSGKAHGQEPIVIRQAPLVSFATVILILIGGGLLFWSVLKPNLDAKDDLIKMLKDRIETLEDRIDTLLETV